MSAEDAVLVDVQVENELGIHARPAAQIAQEAQKYSASVSILSGEDEIDAKSILDILTMAVPHGSSLKLKANGSDAPQAVDAICRLFSSKFGEDR